MFTPLLGVVALYAISYAIERVFGHPTDVELNGCDGCEAPTFDAPPASRAEPTPDSYQHGEAVSLDRIVRGRNRSV